MFDLSIETASTPVRLQRNCRWSQSVFTTVLALVLIAPQLVFAQSVVPMREGGGLVEGNLTSGAIISNQERALAVPKQETKGDATEQEAAQMVLSILTAIDPYLAQEAQTGKLAVFGTPTMGALAHRWAEGFKRFHPAAEVEISEMKGATILKRLAENPTGVAMISRPLTTEDLAKLKKAGLSNPIQIEVGQQGLGVFVHSSNPLPGINREQFLKIFTFELEPKLEDATAEPQQNAAASAATETKARDQDPPGTLTWGEIGLTGQWANMPVHLICRDESSGTYSFIKSRLVANRKIRAAKEICDSSKEMLETISQDHNAIGITNLRSAMSNVKLLKLLDGPNELSANDYSILTGAYPLVRKITLVVDANSEVGMRLAKEFVKFAICQEGQRETIIAGFFPLDPPLIRAQKSKLDSEHLEQEQGKKE